MHVVYLHRETQKTMNNSSCLEFSHNSLWEQRWASMSGYLARRFARNLICSYEYEPTRSETGIA